MRWEDQGIVLGFYPLGERKKIVTLLTEHNGRHKGVWRPSKSSSIQVGSFVKALWSGRLSEQLGTWSLEAGPPTFAYLLQDPDLLMAVHSAICLCEVLLPEREPALAVYQAFYRFLDTRTLKSYCYFELALLNQTSFPLELSQCALGGTLGRKAYVSPKTGRAISEDMAGSYGPRLLPLPWFMHDLKDEPSLTDIIAGLSLTGYFLERYSLNHQGQELPSLRQRLIEQLVHKTRKLTA